jgi:hypothetical protein
VAAREVLVPEIAFAMPIPDDQLEALRSAVAATRAAIEPYAESRSQFGFTKSRFWLQQTSRGWLLIAYYEADDLEQAFARLNSSDAALDLWLKRQAEEIFGPDADSLYAFPQSEDLGLLFSWERDT